MDIWVSKNFLEMSQIRFINTFLQMGRTGTRPQTQWDNLIKNMLALEYILNIVPNDFITIIFAGIF